MRDVICFPANRINPGLKFLTILFLIFILAGRFSTAQENSEADIDISESKQNLAPVKVDGMTLFFVRGVSAFPAEVRASTISKRIQKAAADQSIVPDSVKIIPTDNALRIFAGKEFIMSVYDADAETEGVGRSILAQIIKQKITNTIVTYRHDRSRAVILNHVWRALAATALLVLVLIVLLWLIRKSNRMLQARIKTKIDTMETKTFKLIKSNQLWKAFNVFFNVIRVIVVVFTIAFFVNYILTLFPWTNSAAVYLLDLFINPFLSIWKGFINFLPSLAFLVVIFLITRYFLKLTKLLFTGISHGGISLNNFDPEWAMPTYRILRMFIVAFAIIVAYPYIPGSETSAFKGVTVFIGVLFSLGSSSFIGNLIAGYSMTYRGAFKKGDRIKVDNFIGFVEEQKLLVTRLRSFKNEEIIIPNSILLNSNIINYNTRAKEQGVIIHITVGIGYETPWRLVDSMLKEAADRTEGLAKQPPPYILKHSLDDFAVKYEINAYCHEVSKMQDYKNVLIQNILDVFNENNVQIMTPAYENDPETPKVVPKGQWETPLATDGNPK